MVTIIRLMRAIHSFLMKQIAGDLFTKHNPAFEFVEVAFGSAVFFCEADVEETFDFIQKRNHVNIEQRMMRTIQIGIRSIAEINDVSLAKHGHQASLPLFLTILFRPISFRENFNREASDL